MEDIERVIMPGMTHWYVLFVKFGHLNSKTILTIEFPGSHQIFMHFIQHQRLTHQS